MLACATGIKRYAVRIARPVPLPVALGDQRTDLAAAVETQIDQAHGFELIECGLIVREMLALAAYVLFPDDAEPVEVVVNRRLEFGPAARGIDVLDAQQKPSAELTRHVVIQERGISMAQMQISVRARREAQDSGVHRYS
jgi:hypothetical protein